MATPTTSSTTTTVPATTTTAMSVNPLTDRPISDDELALMPLPDVTSLWAGLELAVDRYEDNRTAVLTNIQAPEDEQADIDRFGRVTGQRTIHRPGPLALTSAISIDTWVQAFETDLGASGYLADFVRDVAKDEDGGHRSDLRVREIFDFVADPVGQETIGLILQVTSSVTGEDLIETLLGFRLGRLLAFVSIVERPADQAIDTRIPIQTIAEALEVRVLDVLEGRIVPEPKPEPVVLGPYAFSYEQSLTESYLRIVFPDLTDVTTTTTTTAPPGSETTTPAETTTSTSSTTTTRIERATDRGSVAATGVVIGDSVDCDLTIALVAGVQRRRYIVIGEQAWRLPSGGEWQPVDVDEDAVASDLIYCPGWEATIESSGLEGLIEPGDGVDDAVGDIPAERFDLGLAELAGIGLAPNDPIGVDVTTFEVWLATDQPGPWIVGVELAYGAKSDSLEPVLGPGFVNGADVTLTVSYRMTALDDESLTIAPPPGFSLEGSPTQQ